MTSHFCSYPEATSMLNLSGLLPVRVKINLEKEGTSAGRSGLRRAIPGTSHLVAPREMLQTLEMMDVQQTLIPSAWEEKSIISVWVACCDDNICWWKGIERWPFSYSWSFLHCGDLQVFASRPTNTAQQQTPCIRVYCRSRRFQHNPVIVCLTEELNSSDAQANE